MFRNRLKMIISRLGPQSIAWVYVTKEVSFRDPIKSRNISSPHKIDSKRNCIASKKKRYQQERLQGIGTKKKERKTRIPQCPFSVRCLCCLWASVMFHTQKRCFVAAPAGALQSVFYIFLALSLHLNALFAFSINNAPMRHRAADSPRKYEHRRLFA